MKEEELKNYVAMELNFCEDGLVEKYGLSTVVYDIVHNYAAEYSGDDENNLTDNDRQIMKNVIEYFVMEN